MIISPPFSVFLRFFIIFIASVADCAQYCAQWAQNEASAEGYFAMTIIHPGMAQYRYNLDLQQLRTTCDLAKGLGLRIGSDWHVNGQSSAQGAFKCNATAVGNRYDPNFACSVGSSSKSCTLLKRTAPDLFTYRCKYGSGIYGSCEVGDISGKFGPAMQSVVQSTPGASKRINTFISNSVLTDYQPPYEAHYLQPSVYSNMWASLVVTCNADSSTLLCAKLQYIPTNEASACNFPQTVVQLHGTTEGNVLRLGGEEIAVIIISVVFFVYAAFTVYLLISRRGFVASTKADEDDDEGMITIAMMGSEKAAGSDKQMLNRNVV